MLPLLASCAFMFNEKTVDVSFASNPQGADIIIDGRNYGKTPATIKLEPKNYVAILNKEGYGSTQVALESWQAIRTKKGDGGRCLADAMGTILVLPVFSYWSVYCRDFKQPEYFVNIPRQHSDVGNGNSNQTPSSYPYGSAQPQSNPYQGY